MMVALALIALATIAYFTARSRSVALAGGDASTLHSRPVYHGFYAFFWVLLPALAIWLVASRIADWYISSSLSERFSAVIESLSGPQAGAFINDAMTLASGGRIGFPDDDKIAAGEFVAGLQSAAFWLVAALVIGVALAGFFYAYSRIEPRKRTRQAVERVVRYALIACSVVAVLTTIGIVFSLIFESVRFFGRVSVFDFLFGYHWSPQSAFEGAGASTADDNSRVFGAIPLFAGTLLITFIAMCVAAPIGLMAAIYLSDYASAGFRKIAKPVLEILAGVPTVVYGFFAALTVAPAIRGWGEVIGLTVSSESALAAGLVMGIMIIPFVSSLSDDVINAVPQSLRDGSAGLGATKSETIRKVVLPAALPGIVSALLLAVSRAIGETMIVVMAAGLAANLTINPLEAVTTVTVQIVTLLVGDQEFDSAKTLAAFALGLVLFIITLALNVVALRVVQKYKEQYD
jgi:phosphate transport system permease protein